MNGEAVWFHAALFSGGLDHYLYAVKSGWKIDMLGYCKASDEVSEIFLVYDIILGYES